MTENKDFDKTIGDFDGAIGPDPNNSPLKSSSGSRSGGKAADDGAPTPRVRDNIIWLWYHGWTVDEIARSMALSEDEVELSLESGSKA